MPFPRVPVVSLSIALCVALLAGAFPATLFAAQDGKVREYIVTVKVKDSGRNIKPDSRANKVRIRQRSKAADEAASDVAKRNGVKAKHRYGNVITGFSTRMTRGQAKKLARDPKVAGVYPTQIYRTHNEKPVCNNAGSNTPCVPAGVKRVKAYQGSPQPVVSANVAVIDSGIGPATRLGQPLEMYIDELKIVDGINCYDDPDTGVNEAAVNPTFWGDISGHGTHVAGTIAARDNNVGAVGVAPGASLFAVRVFGPDSDFTTNANVLCGLDWVADTHAGLVPGVPPVDVVNMSLGGPRPNMLEDCATVGTDPDPGNPNVGPDLIHVAICDLVNLYQVPVVASAGNRATDAEFSAPGGYNQVITVAAMTDTDGAGRSRGKAASCDSGSGEKDDTYAAYSNYGAEIDIAAPGTCVWSTWYRDRSGNELARATGTSMSAPHVTGAIARYIDARGRPSSVGEIRQFIRAAGRSDWNPKNPAWFGVNDGRPPARVLDVAALTGGPAIKTFLFHERIDVAGSTSRVATRVDVQRAGGYADTVDLSASPLASEVGTRAFDRSTLSGLGRNDLGTRLVFDLDPDGGEGFHEVVVTSSGSGVSAHDRRLPLTIDRTKPSVSKIGPKIRGGRAGVSKAGATQVYIQWVAKDNLTGVAAQLQRKTGTAAWKNAGVAGKSSARVYLKPGQDNRFRVKATDGVGNAMTSYSIQANLAIRDSRNSALIKTGSWKTKQVRKAYGGSILIATAGAATLKTKFKGKAVAILAPIGNGRGKFLVRVDGGAWKTVSTKSATGGQRKVVWSVRLANGEHSVEIQRVSGQPAIDGLIYVR